MGRIQERLESHRCDNSSQRRLEGTSQSIYSHLNCESGVELVFRGPKSKSWRSRQIPVRTKGPPGVFLRSQNPSQKTAWCEWACGISLRSMSGARSAFSLRISSLCTRSTVRHPKGRRRGFPGPRVSGPMLHNYVTLSSSSGSGCASASCHKELTAPCFLMSTMEKW